MSEQEVHTAPMRVCKVCKGDGPVGLKVGRIFLGFYCREHADALKGAARLGTSLLGTAVRAYLAWRHPKMLAAIEMAIKAAQAPPEGDYEVMDVGHV